MGCLYLCTHLRVPPFLYSFRKKLDKYLVGS